MLEIATIVLLVLLACLLPTAVHLRVRPPWRPLLARRVIVNLNSGQAIDGVLVRRDRGLLFLRNAALHEGPGDPVPLDGEVVLETSQIDFLQAP